MQGIMQGGQGQAIQFDLPAAALSNDSVWTLNSTARGPASRTTVDMAITQTKATASDALKKMRAIRDSPSPW
jgi:hypothetical protein